LKRIAVTTSSAAGKERSCRALRQRSGTSVATIGLAHKPTGREGLAHAGTRSTFELNRRRNGPPASTIALEAGGTIHQGAKVSRPCIHFRSYHTATCITIASMEDRFTMTRIGRNARRPMAAPERRVGEMRDTARSASRSSLVR